MNIALFGGSFDPPHLGHLTVANTLIKNNYCDTVWFVPCKQHPHLKNLSASDERLEMLKKLSNHSICTYELTKSTPSYSIETLEYFQNIFPTDKFSWVIGSDQLTNFTKWHRYQDILDNFEVLVYPRPNYPLDLLLSGMKKINNVDTINISSTEIRKMIKLEKPIDSHTTSKIVEYINTHDLYK